jgi:16S rRNA (cytidine1402-2'-O)-methyltransferase
LHGISKPLLALHEHNEDGASPGLIERIAMGESAALISDAGTPLIHDPGFPLVRLARERGIRVVPIPGPCALIAALCASGLPAQRFCFEGFPPRTGPARLSWLQELRGETRTLVFYESSHRVEDCLKDVSAIFPPERKLVVARELTKRFETILHTQAGAIVEKLRDNPDMLRGEFVILLEGARMDAPAEGLDEEQMRVLILLLEQCSVKTAAQLTASITGVKRELAYRAALELRKEASD